MSMITAHSGCDGTEDNSLSFIRYALLTEADCLEVDVRPDESGILVLSHDEAGGQPVTLKEAFSLLSKHPDKKMNCDLKTKGLEAAVYHLAEEEGAEAQLIYSGETNPRGMKTERLKNYPNAEIFLNIENIEPHLMEPRISEAERDVLMSLALKQAKSFGAHCINMEYHLLTPSALRTLKEEELTASVWTVNDEADIRRFLDEPLVENITTRNLKAALALKIGA